MKTKDAQQDYSCARHRSCEPNTDAEIDLVEIFRTLWGRRLLIFSLAFLATIIAVIYVIAIPTVFKSKVTISPGSTSGNDISGIESTAFGREVLSPQEVHNILVNTVKNNNFQAEFWGNYILPKKNGADSNVRIKISKEAFLKSLSIRQNGKRNANFVIALSGRDPNYVVDTLTRFVSYVDECCKAQIIDKLKQGIERDRLLIKALFPLIVGTNGQTMTKPL